MYTKAELITVNVKPTKLANIAAITPFNNCPILDEEIVVVVPTVVAEKSIPINPIMIPTNVPANPIYKGTLMRFPISLSTFSRCLSQVSFKILKSVYGSEPLDGVISCKICGKYICHEDFSTLEGFSDGAPSKSTEVLDETDDTKLLNEKQLSIKKKIKKITNIIGIQLNHYDIQNIIEFFGPLSDELIIDRRYATTNGFQKHPEIEKIKKKFPLQKNPKSDFDKKKNIKYKKLLQQSLSSFKQYMIDCNELIIITYLILFHLQTSIPPYTFNSKINI